jgi:hypothetical protein
MKEEEGAVVAMDMMHNLYDEMLTEHLGKVRGSNPHWTMPMDWTEADTDTGMTRRVEVGEMQHVEEKGTGVVDRMMNIDPQWMTPTHLVEVDTHIHMVDVGEEEEEKDTDDVNLVVRPTS